MANTTVEQTNFTAGEFSPKLYRRRDLAKFRNAVRKQQNFVTSVQGAAVKRSGTRYVAEVKDSSKTTRLIPFEFSDDQTYALEVGDLYIRVFRDRAQLESAPSTPIEITTTYLEDDVFDLKFTQSADILFMFHPDFAVREFQRTGVDTLQASWQILDAVLKDGPYLDENTTDRVANVSATTGSGATLLIGFAITAVTTGAGGDFTVTGDASEVSSGDTIRVSGGGGLDGTYTVNTVTYSPGAGNTVIVITGTVPAAAAAGYLDIEGKTFASTDVGRYVRIDNAAMVDWGYGQIATFVDSLEVTIDIINDFATTNDTNRWKMGAFSETTGYPSCGVIHQQRLWLASTTANPQTMWASVSGDFTNFEPDSANSSGVYDGTVEPDDGITRTIDDDQVNAIRWLFSSAKGILIMTSGGEFLGRATSEQAPITPDDFQITRHGTRGVQKAVRPSQVGNTVLFAQRSGRKVRELVFRFADDQFVAPDMTRLAEHLGVGGYVDQAHQEEPNGVLWMVRNDGVLLGMTIEREDDVVAWHQHVIGPSLAGVAEVKSVAVITDSPADLCWLIVERTINGSVVQFVEYIDDEFDEDTEHDDAYFVDSGIVATDTAKTTWDGLDHLEGEDVWVLANGAVRGPFNVQSGDITLTESATKVSIGLRYVGRIDSLDMEPTDARQNPSKRNKRVTGLLLDVHRSLGGRIGNRGIVDTRESDGSIPDTNSGDLIKFRHGIDPLPDEPPLFSGEKEVLIDDRYEKRTGWSLVHDEPLPFQLVAATADVDMGDT